MIDRALPLHRLPAGAQVEEREPYWELQGKRWRRDINQCQAYMNTFDPKCFIRCSLATKGRNKYCGRHAKMISRGG